MLRVQPTTTFRDVPASLATQNGATSSSPRHRHSKHSTKNQKSTEGARNNLEDKKAFNYSVAVWRVQYLYKATSTPYHMYTVYHSFQASRLTSQHNSPQSTVRSSSKPTYTHSTGTSASVMRVRLRVYAGAVRNLFVQYADI